VPKRTSRTRAVASPEPLRVAINGFGRIGRSVARILLSRRGYAELVAVNDHGDARGVRDALQFDSSYGRFDQVVGLSGKQLTVGEHRIAILQVEDPAKLPWRKLKVDVVVESTGKFTKVAAAKRHLRAGAAQVLVSAHPDGAAAYILSGARPLARSSAPVISHASCTTSAVGPILEVLRKPLGIESVALFGVQSVTHSQQVVDKTSGDGRRRRAVLDNIIPVDVDADKAIPAVLPHWRGKFVGQGVRVPTPIVHLAVLTFAVKKTTTVAKVNAILSEAAATPELIGLLAVTDEPVVSQDFRQTDAAAVVDLGMTRVVGKLVQVAAWYDNEWAFATRLVETLEQLAHGRR